MKIIPTLIAGFVTLAIILLALRQQIRSRKSGACGQSCGACGGCPKAQNKPPVV